MAPLPRFEGPRSLLCVFGVEQGGARGQFPLGVSGEDNVKGLFGRRLRRAG